MGNRKLPFGYRMENGEIVIDRREADMVQSIFHAYISGTGFSALADALNSGGIAYYPGKTWNKNMVARLLADERYIGRRDYPQILSEKTLREAAAIRCGRHDTTAKSPLKKALRRMCGCPSPAGLEELLRQALNRLIENPELIKCPAYEKQATSEVAELQRKLDKLQEEQIVDEAAAKRLILLLAAAEYSVLGDKEYETERLRRLYGKQKLMSELDAALLLESVSSVNIHPGGAIAVTLTNGQNIEGGRLNG